MPALSVFTDCSYWLTGFSNPHRGPGSTAPVGSLTVPVMVPDVVPVCAPHGRPEKFPIKINGRKITAQRSSVRMHDLLCG